MKWQRKQIGNRVIWDAELEGDKFLRIVINNSGQYVLHHCCGLEENGITPRTADIVARADKLNDCKKRAKELYGPKPIITARIFEHTHVRLPYKD